MSRVKEINITNKDLARTLLGSLQHYAKIAARRNTTAVQIKDLLEPSIQAMSGLGFFPRVQVDDGEIPGIYISSGVKVGVGILVLPNGKLYEVLKTPTGRVAMSTGKELTIRKFKRYGPKVLNRLSDWLRQQVS